ncbi:MAG: c-type cytochrome [Nitrospirales bacterium]|nr:c-type cytochrome [Nitrospira sp.]MDR4459721.1 c-type cytochrome [Nitrospirales bacterium]
MNEFQTVKSLLVSGIAAMGLLMSACGGGEGPPQPPPPAPPEYADKHMPAGYWNNPEILEEGKAIFTGQQNIDVNCASCHGKDGKPVKAGARDFRRTEQMQLYSDSVWFWRVSEGVSGTKMKAWKSKLSEDAIWKVIAYEATFGLKGKEYDATKGQWVAAGTAGSAPAADAPSGGEPEKAAE